MGWHPFALGATYRNRRSGAAIPLTVGELDHGQEYPYTAEHGEEAEQMAGGKETGMSKTEIFFRITMCVRSPYPLAMVTRTG